MNRDYDNTNRFAVFKNERKRNDRDAALTGTLNVVCPHCSCGSDHFMNVWVGTTKTGEKYMSGSVKAKDKQSSGRPAQSQRSAPAPVADEEIPF